MRTSPLISEGSRQIDLQDRIGGLLTVPQNPVKLEEHSTPLGQQALSCATPHAVYRKAAPCSESVAEEKVCRRRRLQWRREGEGPRMCWKQRKGES